MGIEIERKFLVIGDIYKQQADTKKLYRQGYLKKSGKSVVRVRIADNNAFVTIKGQNNGISRAEFEYQIPINDADIMLQTLCESNIIEKYRYTVSAGNGLTWEIDEFLGDNAGLVVAEIELPNINTGFAKPNWVGEEVSGDAKYYNSNLSLHPFCNWSETNKIK